MAAEADSPPYPLELVSPGKGWWTVWEMFEMNSSGKYGMRTVFLGRAKSYPLGLWEINTSASTRICWKEEDREYIKPSVSFLQYTVGLKQRCVCLLIHHSYLTMKDGKLSIGKRRLKTSDIQQEPQ